MNITDYIKNHDKLKDLDFLTVYMTIEALIEDNYILLSKYVY